ncbi:5,10-methylenetetrahydrofolate reductase [hydrothermal vent metagenome]|uniref:methylenetetrahydrofolate reductase (NADH) n=1 Tax=hydrothermal vent metagenome TaxID=652676 RepID=A0A3B1A024_9ZZZZ
MQTQKKHPQNISCEFFPPKTVQGKEKLGNTINELKKLDLSYISVTFGAGGSTQEGTLETILAVKSEGIDAAPHLSCIGSSRENIRSILDQYKSNGIRRIVALRGDMPSGMREAGEFRYANELVEFIRDEYADDFYLEVAAYPEFHPQAESAKDDLLNFKRKVDAGADAAITQYFYNIDAYLRFVDDCEKMGIEIPITPGIMPITNYTQLARFSDSCGTEIPRWLRRRLAGFGDDIESLKAYGLEVTSELCYSLLKQGAPGLHFYTMNRSVSTLAICKNLGVISQASGQDHN